MKMRVCLLTILIVQTASGIAAETEEQTHSKTSDVHPIQITVEPAPAPIVTIEASPTPNVTIEEPPEPIWWKLLDPLISLIGIALAAWMIVWQLGRQHRGSLALQRENARNELRAKIYSELQEHISQATSAEVSASVYARLIPSSLENYRNQVQMGLTNATGRPIVQERAPKFMDLHTAMSNAVINLISIFESYAIAIPEFQVFQHALHSAMHDALAASTSLYTELLVRLPMDVREHLPQQLQSVPNTYYEPPPPNDVELAEVQRLVNAYLSATDDIDSYVLDLTVESQNTLLKDLYPDRQVPIREPIDPRLKVITSANSEELRRYFREETPWGRSCQEADARVREHLADKV